MFYQSEANRLASLKSVEDDLYKVIKAYTETTDFLGAQESALIDLEAAHREREIVLLKEAFENGDLDGRNAEERDLKRGMILEFDEELGKIAKKIRLTKSQIIVGKGDIEILRTKLRALEGLIALYQIR